MSAPALTSRPGLAVGLKVTAVGLFMVMAAIMKAAMDVVPPGQGVFFRSFLALPVILGWIWARGELRHALIPNNITGHIWRGVFGTSAMGMTFGALGYLPLPDVTAIGYATPIFVVILAALMLGERIRIIRISAVALGLIGVLIVIWPKLSLGTSGISDTARLGALLALAASLVRALVQIHIRTLVRTEHTAAIVFYFSLTATVLSLATLPFGWVIPDPTTLTLLCLSGLLGGVAQILVTSAYRFGGASMLAPYDYTSLIFATIIGYVWFSEWPTLATMAGAVLVIAGNALVLWRERQLGLDRARTRPAALHKD
ncbi:MAG: DMT family transporter [Marinibacterium sp.]